MKKGDIVRLRWRGCKEPYVVTSDPHESLFFNEGLYVDVKGIDKALFEYYAVKDLRPLTKREIKLMNTTKKMKEIGIL